MSVTDPTTYSNEEQWSIYRKGFANGGPFWSGTAAMPQLHFVEGLEPSVKQMLIETPVPSVSVEDSWNMRRSK